MCYFVVVELPVDAPGLPDGLRLEECRFDLRAKHGGRLACVTDGHCSCSIVRRGPATADSILSSELGGRRIPIEDWVEIEPAG